MKMHLLYTKFGVMDKGKVFKQKISYIGNGIPFTFFTFLAHPALTYHKFTLEFSIAVCQYNFNTAHAYK